MEIRRGYILLLLILTNATVFSQDKTDDTKFTTRLDFMVPQVMSNKAFKISFTGILDAGFSVNYRIGQMLNLGIAYRYKQFQVRANKIPDVNMLQHIHNGLFRLSLDKKSGKNGIITPGVNVGYNFLNYTGYICGSGQATETNTTAFNLEPNFSYVWMIDEGFGMGLMVNYNILAYEFDPYKVCLNEHKSYTEDERSGLTGSFSIGFSVFIDFAHQAEGFDE